LSIVIIVTLCFGWFSLFPDEFIVLGKHALAGALSLANLVFISESGYFDKQSIFKPLLHLWSLGIEEQFYIFFPIFTVFIFYLVKKSIKKYCIILTILFIASILSNYIFNNLTYRFYLPFTRAWELLIGSLLASLLKYAHRPEHSINKITNFKYFTLNNQYILLILSILGFIFIALGISISNPKYGYPTWRSFLAILGTILFIFSGQNALINKFLFSNRLMVAIGLISYPMYLWHWPMVSYTRIIYSGLRPSYTSRIIILLSTFLLSFLTYKFIEYPIRFNLKYRKIKQIIIIGVLVIISLIGLVIYSSNGFPHRKSLSGYNQEIFLELQKPDIVIDNECLSYVKFNTSLPFYCRFNNIKSDKTLAIIGDSHAYFSYLGISEINETINLNTLLLGSLAPYRPIIGIDSFVQKSKYKDWKILTDNIYNLLITDNSIINILIIIRGNAYINNFKLEGDPINYGISKEFYLETLQSSIDIFDKANKKVFILIEHPELTNDIRKYIKRPLGQMITSPLKSDILQLNNDYLNLIKQIKHATIIDSIDIFCPSTTCMATSESGLPLYIDNNHLSQAGSRFLANKIYKFYNDN
jgi:peptidoglycan/LPS O-acetylase OafA/YrhL